MQPSPRPRSISAVFAWIVLTAAPAGASPELDAEAKSSRLATYREMVERGTTAFVDRRFTEAREAFERAFAINPDPVLVFNIASTWRRDGHAGEALVEYRRFLTLAPSGDARRMLAEETIAALEAELVPPPRLEHAGPPRSTRSIWRPIGLATTGVGAIGVIAGVVELVRAHSLTTESSTNASSTWDGQRDGDGDGQRDGQGDGQWDGQRDGQWDADNDASAADRNDGSDPRKSAKRRALLFGISGAAVIAAGVTMYVIGKRSERALRVTASANASGGEIMLRGRF